MGMGVKNFLMVGMMAVLFIVLAKVVFTKWNVPYVSPLVQSV